MVCTASAPDTESSGRDCLSVQFEVFPVHVNFGKMHVQNKHFSYCNFKTNNAHSNLERIAASSATVCCATLCGFWLIFEAGKYLLPWPTLCMYFSYYSACQRGPLLARQYISFSVIVSVIVTVLVDKIVVGKCCFNLAFNRLILVATIRTTVTEPANSPVLHSSQLRTCGVSSPELKSPKVFFFLILADTLFWQN